jgi:hypothetical protein
MKDARAIQEVYSRYQRERTAFVGSVFELARHDGNCELLEASDGAHLLLSLLTDPVVAIRRTSTLALGRLAAQSEAVANKIVADGAVKTLTGHLLAPISDAAAPSGETSRRREGLELRRAAAFTLRNACKHNRAVTNAVVEAGALNAGAACLAVPDSETREAAAWLVDCIAGHGEDLAQMVLEVEALAQLVICLDCSEISLKRAAAAALGSIAQHGPKYALSVAAAGAVGPLARILAPGGEVLDLRLARHALCTLSQIALGGSELAVELIATGALPAVVRHLSSPDDLVQRFAASTLRDIACHDASLAKEVASTQHCLQLLVHAMQQSKGLNALPEIMALGHICAGSAVLAEAVIGAGALTALTVAIAHNPEEPVKCAAAWAVGQAGRHGAGQAQAVTESGALLALTGLEVAPTSSPDLALKCSKAACSVIAELESLPALDALLRMPVSSSVKLAVLARLFTILFIDSVGSTKTAFVQNGGLQLVQEMAESENGSTYQEKVSQITVLFPIELVNRYSPAYNKALLEKLTLGGVQQKEQQEQKVVVVAAVSPPSPPPPPPAQVVDETPFTETKPPSPPNIIHHNIEEEIEIKQHQVVPPRHPTVEKKNANNTVSSSKKNKTSSPVAAASINSKPHVSKEEEEEENTVITLNATAGTFFPAPQPPVPSSTFFSAPQPASWLATPHKPLPQTPRDASESTPRPSE